MCCTQAQACGAERLCVLHMCALPDAGRELDDTASATPNLQDRCSFSKPTVSLSLALRISQRPSMATTRPTYGRFLPHRGAAAAVSAAPSSTWPVWHWDETLQYCSA